MPTFEPIRQPNAIDQAVFVISVSQNIAQSNIDQLKELNEQFVDVFDSFDEVKMMGVELTPDGINTPEKKIAGIEFKSKINEQEHLLVKERPDWILRIVEDTIQINCLNYSGWTNTIDFVHNLLSTIINFLAFDDVFIKEIVLQINDTFIVDDDVDNINFEQLFNHCKYLNENIWDRDLLWHANSGWFENDENGNKILNVLNISTRTENAEPIKHITLIEHLQKDIVNDSKSITDLDFLKEIFNSLHRNNKVLITELLSENIKNRIGL